MRLAVVLTVYSVIISRNKGYVARQCINNGHVSHSVVISGIAKSDAVSNILSRAYRRHFARSGIGSGAAQKLLGEIERIEANIKPDWAGSKPD